MLGATPSQTVGPYFKIGLARLNKSEIAGANTPGQRITIEGRVLDSNGAPVPDAVLEIWQADAAGNYADPENLPGTDAFVGFGRIPTDANGGFRFTTIKPGAVTDPALGKLAPHINVTVFMRGLLIHLNTRIYFADEAANANDPIMKMVPENRRETLIAQPSADASKLNWNVRLQGEGETVFFDW